MKTNRIVIVQCRLSSTRLPQKALLPLGNRTVLDYVLSSMHKVRADSYYVATDEKSYAAILPVCEKNGFKCFAGSLDDVLKRFVDLLDTVNAKTVIRATADNPFLCYEAAEESACEFEELNKKGSSCDYLTYSGLPHGCGVEIFLSDSVKQAAVQTSDPYDHEHVGPALYNHRDKFTCNFVPAPTRFNYPQLRATIDTYSDYLRALSVVHYLGVQDEPYTFEQTLRALNAPQVQSPVVFAPAVEKGHGTGHLHRCLSAAIKTKAFVYVPENHTLDETQSVIQSYMESGLLPTQIISRLPDETYSPVIVSDSFCMTKNKYDELKQNRLLISIDESSDLAENADFLLDIIPSYKLERKPNLSDSSLIERPQNKKTVPLDADSTVSSVLVCLGGEDPAGFSVPAAKIIAKCLPHAHITVIGNQPADFSFGNVAFSEPIKNLREKLFEYDLVVTHYGLTAFEAVSAGCKVILLPTTKLHAKLAQKYGFAYVPDSRFDEDGFLKALASPKVRPALSAYASESSLADVINQISCGKRLVCPICGKNPSVPDNVISRNETRTYRRCRSCGIVYMSFSCEPEKKYQKSYFFEDYKKQYGRTYEEDFASIKAQGKRRLDNIRGICTSFAEKNVLDIGCAYGPFLSAAGDSGLQPFGTDISEDAIRYVQEKLKIPAVYAAFPDINTESEFGISQFDIVTMWYVIEHFKDLDSVLRKVSSIVKNDGVFAFSTPSGEGISASSNKDLFYKNSPTDHFTVWELTKCENILAKYAFKVEKIVSTGHHPERFPKVKKQNARKGSPLWNLTEWYSHAMRLGDTVEIYCRKIQK